MDTVAFTRRIDSSIGILDLRFTVDKSPAALAGIEGRGWRVEAMGEALEGPIEVARFHAPLGSDRAQIDKKDAIHEWVEWTIMQDEVRMRKARTAKMALVAALLCIVA